MEVSYAGKQNTMPDHVGHSEGVGIMRVTYTGKFFLQSGEGGERYTL